MTKRRLVVIGNGMGGGRFVEELLARNGGELFDIAVFGDEPYGCYNRILLSSVLAGRHQPSDIVTHPPSWYAEHGVTLRMGVRVDALDTSAKTLRTADTTEAYDVVVFATGSRPVLPPIAGIEHALVFRCLEDCTRIVERTKTGRRAVVIGGGLLGLEAARGLLNHGVHVHVVHLAPHLMEAQLDRQAAEVLRSRIAELGITVSTARATAAIASDGDRVTGVVFSDGSTEPCDFVIVAAGVRPSAEIAKNAGLAVNRGIVVDDQLACSGAADVYAIGDCAEHGGQVQGLVSPAWEQGRILADRLTGRNPQAAYTGSRAATKLKVAGVDLAVMGIKEPVEEDDEVVSYAEARRGIYKKLIVRNDRIAGAIVIGDAAVIPSLTQAFHEAALLSMDRSEVLFPIIGAEPGPPVSAADLPDTAQICDCNAVSKRQIVEAVLGGARSLQAIRECTRASTGCGSCTPEVQKIIDLTCGNVDQHAAVGPPNKIERIKTEKDGLDVLADVPQLARHGWQAIDDADRERLKWGGVFFRRQTPGKFMMRLRMSNGLTNADQVRAVASISEEFGNAIVDITTRQQIQIRGFEIDRLPEIWCRLERVGLCSLQTGMDNIRNVIGCAVAGLTPRELVDASPVVEEFTNVFLRNKAFTNLPRKFNVGISGCTEHCTHAESQDLALTPAVRAEDGGDVKGFNVAIGGKMGSGGCRIATPLNVFVPPEEAAALCAAIVTIFRDHGSRAARTKARLAFLLEEWGVPKFRAALETRIGRPLALAGRDARVSHNADHLGVSKQKQKGLNYVGLAVPVGRMTARQLHETARLAEVYGNGDLRLTTAQNVIVPNVSDERLPGLLAEPLLGELPCQPPGIIRGLVACTGIDYCHFALIETKDIAQRTAWAIADKLPADRRVSMHWSGCPAGCGNHAAADIGLLGKNIRVGDELVDAVDVFVGGRMGPNPKAGVKVLEDVPCSDLPRVLEGILPYVGARTRGHARS